MARQRQDPRTLRALSEHLFYELWMFESVALLIRSGERRPRVVGNALLESFVLHTRVLIEFLYSATAWHDTVVAADFFSQPSDWLAVCPPMSETLAAARARVGKDAAHLTYTRLKQTPETRPWPIEAIVHDVRAAMAAFRVNVPPGHLSWHWEEGIEDDD